jgi:predicted nucleotidyltransferase
LVSNRPDILRVGYFGSYAKNDWGVGSDLDIIVVVIQSNKPFWQRSLDFDLTNLPIPSDILVYTRAEWEEMRKEGRRFCQTVEQEAVWIYEDKEGA